MSTREVTKYPESVLLKKTSIVSTIDGELKSLVKDMFETMYVTQGVGLSANQIGIPKRIAVMNHTGNKEDELVLINPAILRREGSSKMEEGCLSMPGVNFDVKRAEMIEVEFLDLGGNKVRLRMEGLPARIVQHEIDHLNGNVFIDRIPLLKRKSLIKKYNRLKKT